MAKQKYNLIPSVQLVFSRSGCIYYLQMDCLGCSLLLKGHVDLQKTQSCCLFRGKVLGLSCCIFQLWVCGVGRKKAFRSCNNIYLVVSSSFNQIKVMLIPPLPFCRHHSYNACNVHGRMFRKLKINSFILSTLTWLMHVAGCCMLKMILHDFSSSQMLNVW